MCYDFLVTFPSTGQLLSTALPGSNLVLSCRRSNLCLIHLLEFWNVKKITWNYNVELT